MAKQSTLQLHRPSPRRGNRTVCSFTSIQRKESKKDKHLPRGNGHQVPTCCLLRCTGSDRNGCTAALTQRIASQQWQLQNSMRVHYRINIKFRSRTRISPPGRENSLSEWLFRVFCFEYPVNNWSFAFDDVPENSHYSSYLVYAVCARPPPTAKGY